MSPSVGLTEEARYATRYEFKLRADPVLVQRPAHYGFVEIDITVSDFEIEAALRVGAHPCLITNWCSLTTEIRKGHQVASTSLLAFGEIDSFHGDFFPPPNQSQLSIP